MVPGIVIAKPPVDVNAKADAIFFGGRSGVKLIELVEPRGGRQLKDLILLSDSQRSGPVVGTSSFVATLGNGARFLFKLEESKVGVFDATVKSDQVALRNGPFGEAPTTGVFMVHRDYVIVGYILDSDPSKYVVSQIKTGGTNVAYSEESGREGFAMATSKAGFATLMSNKGGDWVFFVPVNGAPRAAKISGKLGSAPEITLKDDGRAEVKNGNEVVFSGWFVGQAPAIPKLLLKRRVLRESGADFDAGVVPGTRMIGFQKRGVVILNSQDNEMVTGSSASNFSGTETVPMLGAGSDSLLSYVLLTGVGPTPVEVPKEPADSTHAVLRNLRFGRKGDAMTSSTSEGGLFFWVAKNGEPGNEAYTLNVYSADSKSCLTFALEDGGQVRYSAGVAYVDGKARLQIYGLPLMLNVTDIVEAP
jgi:hypothetical protein